jgi:hypothetical protein
MKPDANQLYKIYRAWKAAVDEISDVEGLVPTFVMNVLPASALSVAKNNGIGNTWGLDDDQSYIRMFLFLPPYFPAPKFSVYKHKLTMQSMAIIYWLG